MPLPRAERDNAITAPAAAERHPPDDQLPRRDILERRRLDQKLLDLLLRVRRRVARVVQARRLPGRPREPRYVVVAEGVGVAL